MNSFDSIKNVSEVYGRCCTDDVIDGGCLLH